MVTLGYINTLITRDYLIHKPSGNIQCFYRDFNMEKHNVINMRQMRWPVWPQLITFSSFDQIYRKRKR